MIHVPYNNTPYAVNSVCIFDAEQEAHGPCHSACTGSA